ncbi:MAG: hypothetical protein ACR2QF_01775 [Geminicoccaceae bacterium]
MTRKLPDDRELSRFKNPFDAFDAYSKDNGTYIDRSVRDRINDNMESRGLQKEEFAGGRDDIPEEGLVLDGKDGFGDGTVKGKDVSVDDRDER